MLHTLFKKSCMFALVASFATIYTVDDLVDDADRNEMQKESESVSQRFFESFVQTLGNLKDGIQETATDAAAWAQSQAEALGKQLEKTKKSNFVKKAQAKLHDAVTASKNIFNKGKKELEKVDFTETKENIKGYVNQGLDAVQQSSKNAWGSFRNWLNGSSSDSFFKTVSTEDLMIIGGATAVAAVVIGGVTYVLYKSGVIKRIGTEVKDRPVETAAALLLLSAAAFIVYQSATETISA